MSKRPVPSASVQSKQPELTAVGLRNSPDGWIAYTIRTRDGQVVSISESEPNLKQIATDDLKVRVVRELIDAE